MSWATQDELERNPSALAHRATISTLVAAFKDAERVARESFAAIVEAEQKLNAAFLGTNAHAYIRIDASYSGHRDCFDEPDRAIERMARKAWEVIVERLELRRAMSIRAFAVLEKQIAEGELPAISEENIAAFVRQHVDGFAAMFEQAVVEVFEWLRPHHSEHKTNSEFEVGPRVIITRTIETNRYGRQGFGVVFHQQQRLTALENVFAGLDGKGTVNKTHFSMLENAIRASVTGRGETEYFEFRCFGNGNLHLKFKRLDLVAKLNAAAGGSRLKPSREAA